MLLDATIVKDIYIFEMEFSLKGQNSYFIRRK